MKCNCSLIDLQATKTIAQKLRQSDSISVSPIDLSLEKTRPLNIGELQWINFYEPPMKLTLRNCGDTGDSILYLKKLFLSYK